MAGIFSQAPDRGDLRGKGCPTYGKRELEATQRILLVVVLLSMLAFGILDNFTDVFHG
ncbi:MAG: hypothetical protein WC455_17450 [Dehalococcoidia bacterium]|jgi:hypothetical protein